MDNIKPLLKEYARLAVRVGANVQKDQLVLVNAPVEALEFARMIVEEAYIAGAGKVMVEWQDSVSSRLFYEYASDERLVEVPDYAIDRLKYFIDNGGCAISITSPNPDAFKGIDPRKMMMVQQATSPKTKFYSEHMMASRSQWTIVAYPNNVWANKVFPSLDTDKAYQKLLEAILYASRVEEGKSVENWNNHIENLDKHNQILNNYNFKTLHFKNSLGTDLTLDLVEEHIWAGGGEYSTSGILFAPNIPTEETFTMPHNKSINGTVVSTKPLSVRGQIIPEFRLTFKDGKVVEFSATENVEALESLLNTDEGSKSLGEVALISHNSPISNQNILYYNTLFDENASCHLALGNAYSMNIKDGANRSLEDLKENGYNASQIHVDFMFGSSDMEVDGITHSGEKVAIFRKGNFVI